jgi:hypothetical protein
MLQHCHLQKHLIIVNSIIIAFKEVCKIQSNKLEKHLAILKIVIYEIFIKDY